MTYSAYYESDDRGISSVTVFLSPTSRPFRGTRTYSMAELLRELQFCRTLTEVKMCIMEDITEESIQDAESLLTAVEESFYIRRVCMDIFVSSLWSDQLTASVLPLVKRHKAEIFSLNVTNHDLAKYFPIPDEQSDRDFNNYWKIVFGVASEWKAEISSHTCEQVCFNKQDPCTAQEHISITLGSGCFIDGKAVESLIRGLAGHPEITSLDLNFRKYRSCHAIIEGFRSYLSQQHHFPCHIQDLQMLDLKPEEVEFYLSGHLSSQLRSLTLGSQHPLSSQSAALLPQLSSPDSTLKSLSIMCPLTPDQASPFILALEGNTGLEKLHFVLRSLEDWEFLSCLAHVLPQLQKLKELRVEFKYGSIAVLPGQPPETIQHQLLDIMEQNQELAVFSLRNFPHHHRMMMRDFFVKLTAFCNRNKVHKTTKALADRSLPLAALPLVVKAYDYDNLYAGANRAFVGACKNNLMYSGIRKQVDVWLANKCGRKAAEKAEVDD